jgi:dTDP-4-amino-4,6-dideoxygalactose transaminase
MILVVHYFGFRIRNIAEIAELCRLENIILVEDCAHLYNYNLWDYSNAGTIGDFAFYSLHKFFPLKKGGLVIQNNQKLRSPVFSDLNESAQLVNAFLGYDGRAIVEKRRENFKILDKLVSNCRGIKPIRKLNKGDIPHDYPILVDNGLREKLYFWLLDNDIPLIALYYNLITPLNGKRFSHMKFLSNNILNLPIHQDIEEEELNKLVKLIIDGLSHLNR